MRAAPDGPDIPAGQGFSITIYLQSRSSSEYGGPFFLGITAYERVRVAKDDYKHAHTGLLSLRERFASSNVSRVNSESKFQTSSRRDRARCMPDSIFAIQTPDKIRDSTPNYDAESVLTGL